MELMTRDENENITGNIDSKENQKEQSKMSIKN